MKDGKIPETNITIALNCCMRGQEHKSIIKGIIGNLESNPFMVSDTLISVT